MVRSSNSLECANELMWCICNLITECDGSKLIDIDYQTVLSMAIKHLENKMNDKQLATNLIDLISSLLKSHPGAKEYFLECQGDELMDSLTVHTNMEIRGSAMNFVDMHIKAGIQDGDLFF